MASTIDLLTKIRLQECVDCGITFGFPSAFDDQLRENHRSFYCPNGHSQSYVGKTEAEKLREKLEAKERDIANMETRLQNQRDRAVTAERRVTALKGEVTKAKNRAAKGVCPAPGCKRSFVNVARHVAKQHPELVDEHTH